MVELAELFGGGGSSDQGPSYLIFDVANVNKCDADANMEFATAINRL
jgi:hypothetical protein